ncbi:MAG: signal peptidase II [Lachnospiraceae bacterium]|nr:signal peptidase II [Lachnospiraceae bacterium]
MTKRTVPNLIIDIVFMIILIIADQYTKALAVVTLKDKSAIPVISGVLELNYLENRGAAFGMMQNQKIFFIFVAVIILGCIAYVLIKAPAKRKYIILHILLTFIASGAIGNMIDRIKLNYVVDFIYIKIINFPIFNVADIYVTCATFVLVLVLLFAYKDDDLRFLSFRTSGYRTFEDNKNRYDQSGQQSGISTESVNDDINSEKKEESVTTKTEEKVKQESDTKQINTDNSVDKSTTDTENDSNGE